MTSPVLFSTGASPSVSSSSRNLVEFKAGKMEMRDKMVHPLKKQGMVYLRQSQDDSLMHFCWKDRQTGIVEDDLILFPDDCEFKRVKECTTGRVYVLKMKSSNKKMFFWMQESKTEKDDEFCKKINDMLNNPPRAGSDMGGSSTDRELQALFSNMTQEQMAQILGSNGMNLASLLGSATTRSPSSNSGSSSAALSSAAAAAAAAANNNTSAPSSSSLMAESRAAAAAAAASARDDPSINDVRALVSRLLMEGNEEEANMLITAAGLDGQLAATPTEMAPSRPRDGSGGSAEGAAQSQQAALIDLSTAINCDSLAHLLENPDFLRQIEPHLPPVSQAVAATTSSAPASSQPMADGELRRQFGETVRSSQFRSSLSQFCVALQSGQLGPLMSQFGLDQACVDAANLGNLEAFVRALEAHTQAQGQQQAPGDKSR